MSLSRARSGHFPRVYIEGIAFPVMGGSVSTAKDKGSVISVKVRYDKDLWNYLLKVSETENGTTHENGLTIVYDVEMHGLQDNTVITLFAIEGDTGEEILIGQGRLIRVKKEQSDESNTILIEAAGTGYFMEEVTSQMMTLRKSLQVKEDWESQLGVSSVSDVVSALEADGLAEGSLKLLDKAGNKTDIVSNLIWRLHRLFHRFSALDNPKALGSFNTGRMSELLDDSLGEMKADAPLSMILDKIFKLVNYFKICNLCPSYTNATYSSESGTPGTLNECDISVDQESEHVDYRDGIASEKYHLKTNEVVYMPELFLAPPPRCNVIFPTQHQGLVESRDFTKDSTRGIVNVTGEGTISVGSEDDALIMPESVREGIASGGKYYVDPAERITGVKWSSFASSRPQAAEELGSDYMRGLMETIYAHQKYMGHTVNLKGTTFNPKPLVGLPLLILSSDEDHLIADLMGISHQFDSNSIWTNYQIGMTRAYDEVVPSEPATYWYEHDMYSQDNIGSYIYPRLTGQYFEGDLSSMTGEGQLPDRSILVHLYDSDVSVEDAEGLAEAEDAVKNAVDNLWAWYKEAPMHTWFEIFYGRRAPISINHWFKDFFKCKGTEDKFIYYGGYTLATNSVTLEDESETVPEENQTDSNGESYGEKLPVDAKLAGLFVTEKQHLYINPAIRCASMDRVPIEISDPPTQEDLEEMSADIIRGLILND